MAIERLSFLILLLSPINLNKLRLLIIHSNERLKFLTPSSDSVFPIIYLIVSSVNIKVQLGGGIRTLESAKKARSIGVNRIVMGTTAVQDPNTIQKICEEIGSETFVVSIDAKDSQVVINGWTQDSTLDIFELINRIESMGVKRFVYTDITKDGTLTNPNFKTIEQIAHKTSLNMLVAGGISSIEHLITLSELGIEGAIVGKAIYTGDIDIQKANQVLKKS